VAAGDAATSFYSSFIDTVHRVSGPREAEMAKLLENTYRHVNIALVNEMAIFCEELGVDLWEAIGAASTKPFGFAPFTPGPGVGGHCIPVDPSYLSWRVRRLGYPFRFVATWATCGSRPLRSSSVDWRAEGPWCAGTTRTSTCARSRTRRPSPSRVNCAPRSWPPPIWWSSTPTTRRTTPP
jgi:hypothetical protein